MVFEEIVWRNEHFLWIELVIHFRVPKGTLICYDFDNFFLSSIGANFLSNIVRRCTNFSCFI